MKKAWRLSPNEEARLLREEKDKRRKQRLQQVRHQAKEHAKNIREAVKAERQKQINLLKDEIQTEFEEEKAEKLIILEENLERCLKTLGQAHKDANNKEAAPDYRGVVQKENKKRANERHKAALEQEREERTAQEERANRHIVNRQDALEAERLRAAEVAARPPPPVDPVEAIKPAKQKPVKFTDIDAFSTSHYHIPDECCVEKAAPPTEEGDARAVAEDMGERIQLAEEQKAMLQLERVEKARLRGKVAIEKELLKNDYAHMLHDLSDLQRADKQKRQIVVAKLPKQIFVPPHKLMEQKEERQQDLQHAFEDMYMTATDYMGDLSLALDPHPPPDSIAASEALDLTVDDRDMSGTAEETESSIPRDTSRLVRETAPAPHINNINQGEKLAPMIDRLKGTDTRLQTLFGRIKQQRERWMDRSAVQEQQALNVTPTQGESTQHTLTQYTNTSADISQRPITESSDNASQSDTATVSTGSIQTPTVSTGTLQSSSLQRIDESPGDTTEVSQGTLTTDQDLMYQPPPTTYALPTGPMTHTLPTGPMAHTLPTGAMPHQFPTSSHTLQHPLEHAARIRQAPQLPQLSPDLAAYVAEEERRREQQQHQQQRMKQQTQAAQDLVDQQRQELERTLQEIEDRKRLLQNQLLLSEHNTHTPVLHPPSLLPHSHVSAPYQPVHSQGGAIHQSPYSQGGAVHQPVHSQGGAVHQPVYSHGGSENQPIHSHVGSVPVDPAFSHSGRGAGSGNMDFVGRIAIPDTDTSYEQGRLEVSTDRGLPMERFMASVNPPVSSYQGVSPNLHPLSSRGYSDVQSLPEKHPASSNRGAMQPGMDSFEQRGDELRHYIADIEKRQAEIVRRDQEHVEAQERLKTRWAMEEDHAQKMAALVRDPSIREESVQSEEFPGMFANTDKSLTEGAAQIREGLQSLTKALKQQMGDEQGQGGELEARTGGDVDYRGNDSSDLQERLRFLTEALEDRRDDKVDEFERYNRSDNSDIPEQRGYDQLQEQPFSYEGQSEDQIQQLPLPPLSAAARFEPESSDASLTEAGEIGILKAAMSKLQRELYKFDRDCNRSQVENMDSSSGADVAIATSSDPSRQVTSQDYSRLSDDGNTMSKLDDPEFHPHSAGVIIDSSLDSTHDNHSYPAPGPITTAEAPPRSRSDAPKKTWQQVFQNEATQQPPQHPHPQLVAMETRSYPAAPITMTTALRDRQLESEISKFTNQFQGRHESPSGELLFEIQDRNPVPRLHAAESPTGRRLASTPFRVSQNADPETLVSITSPPGSSADVSPETLRSRQALSHHPDPSATPATVISSFDAGPSSGLRSDSLAFTNVTSLSSSQMNPDHRMTWTPPLRSYPEESSPFSSPEMQTRSSDGEPPRVTGFHSPGGSSEGVLQYSPGGSKEKEDTLISDEPDLTLVSVGSELSGDVGESTGPMSTSTDSNHGNPMAADYWKSKSCVKNSSDRKKSKSDMKKRTERLYSGLDEVKTKRTEKERNILYTDNREKAIEYAKKRQAKLKKKILSKKQ